LKKGFRNISGFSGISSLNFGIYPGFQEYVTIIQEYIEILRNKTKVQDESSTHPSPSNRQEHERRHFSQHLLTGMPFLVSKCKAQY
jgi:hypothetical protein